MKLIIHNFFLLLGLACLPALAFSQKTIAGTVTDAGSGEIRVACRDDRRRTTNVVGDRTRRGDGQNRGRAIAAEVGRRVFGDRHVAGRVDRQAAEVHCAGRIDRDRSASVSHQVRIPSDAQDIGEVIGQSDTQTGDVGSGRRRDRGAGLIGDSAGRNQRQDRRRIQTGDIGC